MIPVEDWGNCVSSEGVATLACIPIVIQNIINVLVVVSALVAIFFVLFAGYKFVMSEGDPEKIASARKTLTYAIAGLVFILLSFVIMNAAAQFTGVAQIAPKP